MSGRPGLDEYTEQASEPVRAEVCQLQLPPGSGWRGEALAACEGRRRFKNCTPKLWMFRPNFPPGVARAVCLNQSCYWPWSWLSIHTNP